MQCLNKPIQAEEGGGALYRFFLVVLKEARG